MPLASQAALQRACVRHRGTASGSVGCTAGNPPRTALQPYSLRGAVGRLAEWQCSGLLNRTTARLRVFESLTYRAREELYLPYANKDVQREFQRVWRAERRATFFADKTCTRCQSTDQLELDHVDPNTKVYNPARLWSMSDDNPAKIAELDKCQILCNTCHKEKTMKYRTENRQGHGTVSCYVRGCRLDPCRLAHNQATTAWKRKRRSLA